MKVYGITGWKTCGKAGVTVSTVKHAHHATEIDHPGSDSFRHRAAGAGQVSSPRQPAGR